MNRSRPSRARPRGILAILAGLAVLLAVGICLLANASRARGARTAVVAADSWRGADVAPAGVALAGPREAEVLATPDRETVRTAAPVAAATSDRPTDVPPSSPYESRLSGRVTEIGLPLAGAKLHFSLAQADALAPRADLEARTDGEGRYRLEDVPPGAYRLQVLHHSRSTAFESPLEVRAGTVAFDVDLPLAVIEGRVLDPHGAPIASIHVQAKHAPGATTRSAQEQVAGGGVFTAVDGRYVLRGVPCDVELVVEANSRGLQLQASEVMRLAANEVRSGIDLTLARGADLNVLVRGAADRARADWLVQVSPAAALGDPARLREVNTDSNGRARFAALAPGLWLVRVESPGDALAPGGVVQEQLVDVALDQPNDVAFRVD